MSAEPPPASHRSLRRLGGGLVALAIGLGAVVLLLLFLSSRDTGHVAQESAAAQAPGQQYATPERYLDGAQLRLLAAGDVYLLYGDASAPPALRALRERLSGPPDDALEQAGQAVILLRRAGTDGVVALGGDRILRTGDPADPALETFASYWLGGGAGG